MSTQKLGKIMIVLVALIMMSFNAWATIAPSDDYDYPYMGPAESGGSYLTDTEKGFDGNKGKPQLLSYMQNNVNSTITNDYLKIDVPAVTGTIDGKTFISIDTTGYQYIALHFGNSPEGNYTYIYNCAVGGFQNFSFNNGELGSLSNFTLFKATEMPQVPIPPAALLFGTGLAGLVGVRRKMRKICKLQNAM